MQLTLVDDTNADFSEHTLPFRFSDSSGLAPAAVGYTIYDDDVSYNPLLQTINYSVYANATTEAEPIHINLSYNWFASSPGTFEFHVTTPGFSPSSYTLTAGGYGGYVNIIPPNDNHWTGPRVIDIDYGQVHPVTGVWAKAGTLHVTLYDDDPQPTGDVLVKYTYDYRDRLVERRAFYDDTRYLPGEVDRFVYDGDQVLARTDLNGNLKARYLWGPQVDMLLADEQYHDGTSDTYWALTDHEQSVPDLVQFDAGQVSVVNHRVYDAFGKVTSEINPSSPSTDAVDEFFSFTGRFYDEASQLQNNLHRWYDPLLHQWLSEDPEGFDAGDANTRRYVGNDPVNRVDPSGLDYIEVTGNTARYVSESDFWLDRRLNRGSLATRIGEEVSPGFIKLDPLYGGSIVRRTDLADAAHGVFSSTLVNGAWQEDALGVYERVRSVGINNALKAAPTSQELAQGVIDSTLTVRYLRSAQLTAQKTPRQGDLSFFNPTSENFGPWLAFVCIAGGALEVGPTAATTSLRVTSDGLAEEFEKTDNLGAKAILGTAWTLTQGSRIASTYAHLRAEGALAGQIPGVSQAFANPTVQRGALVVGGGLVAKDVYDNNVSPENIAGALLTYEAVKHVTGFSFSTTPPPDWFPRGTYFNSGVPLGQFTAESAIVRNPSQLVCTRVDELRGAIPSAQQGRITMAVAVLEDASGARSICVSSSEGAYLRAPVRSVVQAWGDAMVATGVGHAEANIVAHARANSLRVIDIGATRPVCVPCQDVVDMTGANISTPRRPR
jgi:RHS repeat-associated protein